MNREIKNMIRKRAQRLAPYLADHLQYQDPSDWVRGQAYRFCYLLLRGPRQFFDAFHHGELHFNLEAIEEVYWEFRSEIEGGGLLHEEKTIILDHNLAVDALLAPDKENVRFLYTGTTQSNRAEGPIKSNIFC